VPHCGKTFKYLGHILTASFTDDEDIDRVKRNSAMRVNLLIRKFNLCSEEVKCHLLSTYCGQFDTCSLWARYKRLTMDRLRVCHNTILRTLLHLPPWTGANNMFATLNVRSHQEIVRLASFGLCTLVDLRTNELLHTIGHSDASVISDIRTYWSRILYTN